MQNLKLKTQNYGINYLIKYIYISFALCTLSFTFGLLGCGQAAEEAAVTTTTTTSTTTTTTTAVGGTTTTTAAGGTTTTTAAGATTTSTTTTTAGGTTTTTAAGTTTTTTTTTSTTSTTTTTTTSTTTTTAAGGVSGTVTWPGLDNAALAGVVVTLEGSTQTTTTGANGKYTFTNVSTGEHAVSFYQVGWTFYPLSESINYTGEAITVNATAELTSWAVQAVAGVTADLNKVDINGTTEAMIVGDNSTALRATNLNSWNWAVETSAEGKGDFNGVFDFSSQYFVCMASSGSLYQATDWGSWSLISSLEIAVQSPFASLSDSGNQLYLCIVSNDKKLYAAPFDQANPGNPLTWEAVSGTGDFQNQNLTQVEQQGVSGSIQYLWLVGEGGKILKSENYKNVSGTTLNWTAKTSGVAETINDISPFSQGFLVTANGTILSTTNTGESWSISVKGIPRSLNGIASESGNWIIVGSEGLILKNK